MNINLFIIPIIIILGILHNNSDFGRKSYITLCCFILMLTCALRSIFVGSDTQNYYNMYMDVINTSWNDIWIEFIDRYVNNVSEEDIGYVIFQKVISILTHDFHLFTFIAQLSFFIPMGLLLYKYTSKIIQLTLAFILYASLMNIIALSGGRQLYAIGFCIMAFISFIENKYKSMGIYIIMASFIHLSALLILIPITLNILSSRWLKRIHLLTLTLLPITLIYVNKIIIYMGNFIHSDKFARYGEGDANGGAILFIALMITFSFFCLITIKHRYLLSNNFLKKLYCMLPCISFFSPLVHADGAMIRVSMYFHLYLLLILPYSIDLTFNNKNKNYIYLLITFIFVIYALKNDSLSYYFFWQKDPIYTW